ncbi:MAG: glycosyltransferase family 4 protein [Chitinophagaceae bacterium]
MNKPAILLFATQYMPTGGIESHLREFCMRMHEAGVSIDLVIANSQMLPETKAFFVKVCRNIYLGHHEKPLQRMAWLFAIGAKLAFKNYDAFYSNGQGESVIFFSKLLQRRKKWVLHHHTAGDANDQETWGNQYYKALMKADHVIACSAKNAGDIEKRLSRKIESIPCFSRKAEAADRDPGSVLKFGYYGRLIPEKGIDLLCRLAEDADMKGIEFHIWGEGAAYPKDFFANHPALNYHGAFSGEKELNQIIGSIDAYLLLSVHPEGLPIALLEIMSAGLPWIATDRGGIRDIAIDPMSTRVIPADMEYEKLKQDLLLLAADIRQHKTNKAVQRKLYADQFSYPVLVKRWKEVMGINNNSINRLKVAK